MYGFMYEQGSNDCDPYIHGLKFCPESEKYRPTIYCRTCCKQDSVSDLLQARCSSTDYLFFHIYHCSIFVNQMKL